MKRIISQQISKAMPLPVDSASTEVLDNNNFDIGYWDIDDMMEQTVATEQKNIFPQSVAIGAGREGLAAECYPGIVCKYSPKEYEARTAEDLMQTPCPNAVKVYGVNRIQSDPAIWLIMTEKVTTLSKAERRLWAQFDHITGNGFDVEKLNFINSNHPELPYIIQRIVKSENVDMNVVKLFANKYTEFIKGVVQCGLNLTDAHSQNVGYNRIGRIVLFDLGRSKYFD